MFLIATINVISSLIVKFSEMWAHITSIFLIKVQDKLAKYLFIPVVQFLIRVSVEKFASVTPKMVI